MCARRSSGACSASSSRPGSAAPDAWSDANRIVFAGQWERWAAFRSSGVTDFGDWWLRDNRRWLIEMCERVGVAAPDDLDGTVEVSQRYVVPRVRAGYPETVAAIRALGARVRLETASGQNARGLEEILRGLEVRELFGPRLYGPDLLGVDKIGPQFFDAILRDTGVDANAGLVVDDTSVVLDWAASVGLRTVLMDRAGGSDGRHTAVRSLVQVAALLDDARILAVSGDDLLGLLDGTPFASPPANSGGPGSAPASPRWRSSRRMAGGRC